MRNLLYLGNQLSKKNKTPTTIDVLSELLTKEHYQVITASSINNKILRLFNMLWFIMKYRKWLHYTLIDTYSTQNFYYAYLSSQLCRLLKLKYIPILHGGNLPERLIKSKTLSRAIFKHAYINVTPSKYLKHKFSDYGYNNVIEIPNSIHLKNYVLKKRVVTKPKLFWVRSFSKTYNPLLAISIMKQLLDNNIEAELCMVGPEKDGTLKTAKAYAKKLNVRVKFTGKLKKTEWIKLSKEYNIFINTTNFDNMPVSVIEAMALGLPIISTNVGGIPYLIEKDINGLLVKPNDPALFVQAIQSLILNPKRVHILTENARTKAEAFDWDIIKNEWNALLV